MREYAAAVFEHLAAINEAPERIVSPAEWDLLRSWMHYGIPLRVVLRAMADCPKPAKKLTYYFLPVEQAYRRWKEAVG